MTETSVSEPTPTPHCASEEILKLKCPSCGGGLDLKRKFLGLTGHCVHCQTPLTALGEIGAGEVQLFADTGAAGVEMAGSERESCDLARTAFPAVPGSTALTPLPTRLSDNPFPTAENPPNPFDLKTSPSSAPFGGDHASRGGSTVSAFALPGSEVSVMAGWGTNIPREVHASISPFGLKAHHGSGLSPKPFSARRSALLSGTQRNWPHRPPSAFRRDPPRSLEPPRPPGDFRFRPRGPRTTGVKACRGLG
jgi:hypothetical protein